MSKNPCLYINLNKIKKNAEYIKGFCQRYEIEVVGITKGCCAIPEVAEALVEGGINFLGDSRIKNLQRLKEAGIKAKTMLIRTPMLSEIDEVLKWADISLNSEITVIKSLSEATSLSQIIHPIILMIELGDLREGLMPDQVLETVEEILSYKGVKLIGIGTNFGCISGVLPTSEEMYQLVRIAEEIEATFSLDLEVISGGSTNVLKLVEENTLPKRINQLRIGVGILLGQDDARESNIIGTYQDTFILNAEIIEIKEKPSFPQGKIGRDAFGEIPILEDLGIRRRALLALGKQDIQVKGLIPTIEGVKIIGASSDHLVLDITESKEELVVGDEIRFQLNYPALLSASTSEYVYKFFIRGKDEDVYKYERKRFNLH